MKEETKREEEMTSEIMNNLKSRSKKTSREIKVLNTLLIGVSLVSTAAGIFATMKGAGYFADDLHAQTIACGAALIGSGVLSGAAAVDILIDDYRINKMREWREKTTAFKSYCEQSKQNQQQDSEK